MVEGKKKKKARIAWGCLTALFAANAALFLVLTGTYLDRLIFEPRRAMARLQRMIPRAIEIFEQSRERLDVLVYGEFARGGHWFSRGRLDYCEEGRPTFMEPWEGGLGRPPLERLEALPDEERDAVLFLMTSEEPGGSGFRSIASPSGGVFFRATPYIAFGNDRISITYGEILRPRTWGAYTVDLGYGYTLHLGIYRMDLPMIVAGAAAGIVGIITLLLSLPLIWYRIKRRREAKRDNVPNTRSKE